MVNIWLLYGYCMVNDGKKKHLVGGWPLWKMMEWVSNNWDEMTFPINMET